MGAGQSIPGDPLWDGEQEDTAGWPGLEQLTCDHCGAAIQTLRRCGACRAAFFCGRECQRAAWPQHREACGTRQRRNPGGGGQRPPGSPATSGPSSPRTPGAAADALRRGIKLFNGGNFREAMAEAEAAAEEATAESEWELRYEALRLRGQCLEQLQDLTGARRCLGDALAEVRERLAGHAASKAEANLLLRLGAVAMRSAKPQLALQYQRKAVAILEADGSDKDSLAAAYNSLGISAGKRGLTEAARSSFQRAKELRKESGNVEGLCACVSNLANLLRAEDRSREAAKELEEARRLASEAGNLRLERQVLLNLANLYENEFDKSVAEECRRAGDEDGSSRQGAAADEEPETGQEAAPVAALRCRRALFGLPPARRVEPAAPAACGSCSADLSERPRRSRCGRCHRAWYCDATCQRAAWKEHAVGCRPPAGPSELELELRDRTCPVCLEPLGLLQATSEASRVTILQCLHCMHMRCWRDWEDRGRGAACPVCRDCLGFMA